MKINVLGVIKDYQGKDLTENKEGKKEPVTVRDVFEAAINSLKINQDTKQPELLTAEVRNKIYQINLKLYAKDDPDLTVTELAFIKERADIGFANNPLIYGRICEIIEGIVPAAAQPATTQAPAEKGAVQ